MRKTLLSCFVLATGVLNSNAQSVATFDDLTLPKADTFYVNYATPMSDVGFNDGLAHFPCYYDTSWGGLWNSGFAYSNMTDSVTSGYTNEYSAKAATGYAGSANYVVAYCPPSITTGVNTTKLTLLGAASGMPVSGFYVTNGTYAYNSMLNGDGIGKKFGDTSGNYPDWFKLTIKGMNGGAFTADRVDFYLADYRFADNDSDYIVKTWQWVDLLPLGHVDSLVFNLTSSDNGIYGMNTPAYFCMDNFTTNETGVGVNKITMNTPAAKIYPIPANDQLFVEANDNWVEQITVTDQAGAVVASFGATSKVSAIDVTKLTPGLYVVDMTGNGKHASGKFIKQ